MVLCQNSGLAITNLFESDTFSTKKTCVNSCLFTMCSDFTFPPHKHTHPLPLEEGDQFRHLLLSKDYWRLHFFFFLAGSVNVVDICLLSITLILIHFDEWCDYLQHPLLLTTDTKLNQRQWLSRLGGVHPCHWFRHFYVFNSLPHVFRSLDD